MTIDQIQPSGSLIGHVFKRLFLAALGYVLSVVLGLIAIVATYSLLSWWPNAPAHFRGMAMTPVAMLFLPPLWIFIVFIAIVATLLPALLWILLSEAAPLRSAWLHMLVGAATSLIGYLFLAPDTEPLSGPPAYADFGIIVAAGLIAGLVYWLIAGRDSGFRRRA